MEPKFQTSFIPKSPISTRSTVPDNRAYFSISILGTLSKLIFVIALVVAGGLFGYEKILRSQLAQADQDLVGARGAFEPEVIDNLVLASRQIISVKSLIDKHISTLNMFKVLHATTLPSVKFNNFHFDQKTAGLVSISLDGEAESYAAIAKQAEIFSNEQYIKNPSFNDMDLTDKGAITMKFKADVDFNLISYKETLTKLSADTTDNTNTTN